MGPESQLYAPTAKTDMNPRKNGGLEDDFPFHLGEFLGPMLIFWGVSRVQGVK